mmetsp:Transcript_26741/g.58992  ORF Transcript_26741/g.58992 Transcript_26741/m.58992 type:complete len:215 (-) Transcript_26741:1318-1962(-)
MKPHSSEHVKVFSLHRLHSLLARHHFFPAHFPPRSSHLVVLLLFGLPRRLFQPVLGEGGRLLVTPTKLHHHGRDIVFTATVESLPHQRLGSFLRVLPLLQRRIHCLLRREDVKNPVSTQHHGHILFIHLVHRHIRLRHDQRRGRLEVHIPDRPSHPQPLVLPLVPVGVGIGGRSHSPRSPHLEDQPTCLLHSSLLLRAVRLVVLGERDGFTSSA